MQEYTRPSAKYVRCHFESRRSLSGVRNLAKFKRLLIPHGGIRNDIMLYSYFAEGLIIIIII